MAADFADDILIIFLVISMKFVSRDPMANAFSLLQAVV